MDYTEVAADVLAAFQEDGMAMTVRRATGGTYNPATGSYTGVTSTDYPAWGLITAQSMPQSGNTGERFNGMLVQTDDEFIMLAASGLTVTPVAGDFLVIAAVIYSIVTLIAVKQGGKVLFYRLWVRK